MRALVFGGSGALGSEIARKLARDGASVALSYYSNEKKARELAAELGAHAFRCDLRDGAGARKATEEAIAKLGGVDAIAFAVAPTDRKIFLDIPEITPDEMMAMLALNTAGPFAACQAALPELGKNGGNIVFIGTLAGSKAVPAPAHLAASKAALRGMVESMSKEVGERRICVNLVQPGLLEGGSSRDIGTFWREGWKKRCQLHRVGTFAEIAEVVAWFCLENTYVTGQPIVVDGGL